MARKRRFAKEGGMVGRWLGGGAGLAAAGAAFAWFKDASRRARATESAQRLYAQAGALASTGARDLSHRARDLGDRAQQLTQHARSAADETRAKLESEHVLPGGAASYRVVAGAAGAFLVARAVLGNGRGRIPAGNIGGGLLGRVLRDAGEARAGASPDATGAARAAETDDEDAHPRADAQGGTAGRPQAEVHEVKSPAELEPGLASASPDPLRPGRVDRPDLRDRKDERPKYDAGGAAGERDAERTSYEVAPHGFSAPPPGAGVREADLGIVTPAEDLGEDEDDAATRRDPTNDGG
jgi:hypothetical protein